jgi:cytochrome c biogenesis protein CcmG, thiol:disulfide interchange protein DsbE
MQTRHETATGSRIDRWFGWGIGALAFAGILAGLLSVGAASQGSADLFLRRSNGEPLKIPLTRAQTSYALEARRGGMVVPTTLADFDSRLVFVNFWGTYCPPCIEELPSLLALARSRDPKELVVVAVSYDDSWREIDEFFARFSSAGIPSNFIVVRDPNSVAGRDLKAAFGTEKIPESYLVRGGTIEAKFVNARDWVDPAIVGLIDALSGT